MKKIALYATLALTSVAVPYKAQAGKAILDTRMDYLSYKPNDDTAASSYSNFQISRLKVDLQGQLSDSISGRVRIDPLNNAATATTRDKTSKFVDFAFLSHKFSDNYVFSLGKIMTGMGATESTNNPADIYLRSLAGDEVAAIFWPAGASLDLNFGMHGLKLAFTNVTEDITNAGKFNQTTAMTGFTYAGKLFEGSFQPFLTHFQEKYTLSTGIEKTNSYSGVGGRMLFDAWTVEVDYLLNKFGYSTQANNDKLSTTSAIALVRYNINEFGSVHAKYESTDRKTATGANTDTNTKYTGMTLAVEYKPIKEENWRAHLALTQLSTKADGATTTPSEQKIFLGVRSLIDILK